MRRLIFLLCLALPLAAQYAYFSTTNFQTGIPSGSWQSNGTITSSASDGLTTTATNGGSVIYKNPVADPAGGTDLAYEVKAKLRITTSGGTFSFYSHASMNALAGPAVQGTFYVAELTPTVSAGGCSMALNAYRVVSGVVTLIHSGQTLACKDGMTVRYVHRYGYFWLYTSLNDFAFIGDAVIGAGRPGLGARAMPSGNGILEGQLGTIEFNAPATIDLLTLRTALFDTRVDFEWPGVADNTNGSGLMFYQLRRDGVWMGNIRGTEAYFSDTTVVPGTTYTYTIVPNDVHLNGSVLTVTVTTPPAGQKDPRKTGVRPLGTYWGTSPENIDLQSGNLSFSLPTVTALGRGGTSVPFRLSNNSQNWRKDPSGVWKLGTDVGFGWGWKMLAGSLTPVYSDWYALHHFIYTDSTGAEYDLDVNDGGIWRSKEGIFVEYDAIQRRLYFPGGTFWEFDCQANGTEADAGTLYPTRLVDTNGNEIKLRYQGGLYYGGTNGSGRVTEIEDVRAAYISPGLYRTYAFHYNSNPLTGPIPHLVQIRSDIGDGQNFDLSYSSAVTLADPFPAPTTYGIAYFLHSMTIPGGLQFAMEYNPGSLELKKVTMPLGGTLEWTYAAKSLLGTTSPSTPAGPRTQMEVVSRILNANDLQGNKTYTIAHDDVGDAARLAHAFTIVSDASGAADKKYYFNVLADYKLGLLSALDERAMPSTAIKRNTNVTWSQTLNLNPYIYRTEEVVDSGQPFAKQSNTEQTINDHGNVVERKQYGYFTPGGTPPLERIFIYQYLGTAPYTSRHIWNRLEWVKVRKPGGSLITLASNTYDIYSSTPLSAVSNPSVLRQHDTSNYGLYMPYRGNVTNASSPGKSVNMTYDYTGTTLTSADTYGHLATQTPDSTRNYAVPSAVTAGSVGTSFTWNGYSSMTATTGPNSASASFSYDAYARPASRTAPNGSVTTFTYTATAPHSTLAVTGTRGTRTSVDGFGRPLKVETGYMSGSALTVVSTVETKYAPCACTPIGKLWKTSMPYAPGGSVVWTEHVYDALGRTLQVIQPSASGTTTYSYTGAEVKVTDPASVNNWKKYENDSLGNLIKVTEPRPGGGGATDETLYTYSELGQLLTSSMTRIGMGTGNGATVTQTRTWVYDSNQRLTSVRHPESSTVTNPSIRYDYNTDGTLKWKKDALDQRVEYTYDSDGRVTAARRYAGSTEDTCARVDYHYNSQPGSAPFDASFTANATGRLAATATGCSLVGAGQLIEMYSYTSAGAVTKKRLRIVRAAGTVDKDVTYAYGSDGKLSTVLYPGATVPYTYTYDQMGRPTKMTGPSGLSGSVTIDHAKDVIYGPAGQITEMKYLQWQDSNDNGAPYYFLEKKDFNSLYQLIKQKTTGTGGTAAEIEYYFSSTANNGRITGRKNLVSGEDVVYSYDELNRLVSASISGAGGWGQSFTHDGFGNLWAQTVTKGTAPPMSLNFAMATNRINSSGWTYDANGNTLTMPVLGGGTSSHTFDIDNRMVSWTGGSGTESYGYLADNKRVWKKTPAGAETYYFYGAGGQKIATYSVQSSPFALINPSYNIYFAGKLIRSDNVAVVHDRLGSVVARSGCLDCSSVTKKDYFAYGDEIGTATSGNVDKFGTYLRDQTSGLDYADQRYFAGTLGGRFLSADPYEASGGAANPGSWGRYAYVGGDPVNRRDPRGLESSDPGDDVFCIHTGTVIPEYICRMYAGQNDPTNQYITCSDGTRLPQGSTCPSKDGGSFKGRERAHEGLKQLTASRLLGNKDCVELLEKLAEKVGGGATAASIAGAVERQAMQTYNSWTMYDGPSASTVALEAAKFGNAASGNVKTVADWFNFDNGRQGLSQQNGSTIFIRSDDWGAYYNSYTTLGGELTAYGFGTLLHEVLHKQSVGGISHGQMESALEAVGFTAADNPLFKNINSSGFGAKCF